MKQKLNVLDLKSVVSELQNIVGLRLQNIYDLSERMFQFKFSSSGRKEYLLVESGSRIHLTNYVRETATLPSQFCAKLRKHLKTKRLMSLKQIGNDRIVCLSFGTGGEALKSQPQYYLIFEFYAAGNILLTDSDMKILSLLRFVRSSGNHQQFSVGEIYQITATSFQDEIKEMTMDTLTCLIRTLKEKYLTLMEGFSPKKVPFSIASKKGSKKEKNLKDFPLKKFISWELNYYGNSLVEHIIRDANINPDMKIDEFYRNLESINMDDLLSSFQRADSLLKKCKENLVIGYIVEKIETKIGFNDLNCIGKESSSDYIKIYIDFNPFIPKQFSNNPNYSIVTFNNGYNNCIDTYFFSIESQKFDMKLKNQEDIAYRRLQTIREEHQKKINDLREFQDICIKKANAIEENLEIVDETIKAVNSCIVQSMDWEDIAKLIETEKEYGNPAAEIISFPLKLNLNTITIKLPSPHLNDNVFNEEPIFDLSNNRKDKIKTLSIDIKLSLNAWTNARDYYDRKKAASIKEEKTIAASSKALKNAESKIKSDLKKNIAREKKKLVPIRNLNWFEKFLWFISSDGYLVLGGRDLLQNKILVEEYFSKNDIYVHADLKDAAVVIIKNHHSSLSIPPSTLNQAGTFSIAKSNAWTSKIVTSAWWVYYDQVLKDDTMDGSLSLGVFAICGKKNFLPPSQLLLGYGILWTINEDSKVRRLKNKSFENSGNDLLTYTTLNEEIVSITEKTIDLSLKDNEEKTDIDDIKINQDYLDNFEKISNQDHSLLDLKDMSIIESTEKIINRSKYDIEEYIEPSFLNSKQIISDICSPHEKIDKKRISVKERRDIKNIRMKKNQKLNDNNEKIHDESELLNINVNVENSNSNLKLIDTNKPKEKNSSLLSTNVRGKKGKIKKIMLKYADQDEDDRALRMELLGSNKSSKKKERNLKDEKNKKALPNKNVKKISDNIIHNNKEIHQQYFEKKSNQLLKTENNKVFDDKEKNYEINLDSFVTFPLPDDVLVDAIPVCAPYLSMTNYKYKVKLQPGSTKKGKAIRNIVAYWDTLPVDQRCENKEKAFPKEKELIRSLRDSELLAPVYVPTLKTMMGKSGNTYTKTKCRKRV